MTLLIWRLGYNELYLRLKCSVPVSTLMRINLPWHYFDRLENCLDLQENLFCHGVFMLDAVWLPPPPEIILCHGLAEK